ncbi:MAG: hypothetical protein U1F63_03865 [Chitinivorax sp.]
MSDLAATPPLSLAEQLNLGCACQFLDRTKLQQQLEAEPALAGLATEIAGTRPHLFAATMVFITSAQRQQMQAVIAAVEQAVALPAWQQAALRQAPASAAIEHGASGVFFGYDFHLGPAGPQLIEINTNAGGAYLNLALARAQTACCAGMQPLYPPATALQDMEQQWLAMFRQEWQAQGHGRPLTTLAIIDESPQQQYLYPEFLLFQRLFERAGIRCLLADPAQLIWRDGRLWLDGQAIDLVYNRLTDFYLTQPASRALLQAHRANAVVLTPHPRAHALYADKRHLAWLSDPQWLAALGLPSELRQRLLAGVPATRLVTPANANELWAQRRQLFFKPASGFGSRAAYRGDKLTRRVWDEIVAGEYVAQRIALPSERVVALEPGNRSELKLDVRAYVYRGRIQLFAARLYSGQTTNFRTAGGGFAPVFVVSDPAKPAGAHL